MPTPYVSAAHANAQRDFRSLVLNVYGHPTCASNEYHTGSNPICVARGKTVPWDERQPDYKRITTRLEDLEVRPNADGTLDLVDTLGGSDVPLLERCGWRDVWHFLAYDYGSCPTGCEVCGG